MKSNDSSKLSAFVARRWDQAKAYKYFRLAVIFGIVAVLGVCSGYV